MLKKNRKDEENASQGGDGEVLRLFNLQKFNRLMFLHWSQHNTQDAHWLSVYIACDVKKKQEIEWHFFIRKKKTHTQPIFLLQTQTKFSCVWVCWSDVSTGFFRCSTAKMCTWKHSTAYDIAHFTVWNTFFFDSTYRYFNIYIRNRYISVRWYAD